MAPPGTVVMGTGEQGPDLAGLQVRALRGVRLLDGSLADLDVEDGTITAVRPARQDAETLPRPATSGGDGVELDGRGWRYLPAAGEPHAHLDKALTARRIPSGAGNDLVQAIEQWRTLVPLIDGADVRDRALEMARTYAAHGITTIRTHADAFLTGDPLRGVDALLGLRDVLAGHVTLQVCLLAGPLTPDAVVEDAIARGIDVIGGCPHLAPDPHAETTRMLDLAERSGLPVDLHADEQTDVPDDVEHLDIVDMARQVLARGLGQRVTASHCVRLGSLPPERLAPVLDLVREAGLGVVTLPITNLYLQGRAATHLAPRGITAVRQLLDAGIPLAAGGDNVRDPFNPAGAADPFETTSLLMTAGHLLGDEALAAVTTGVRTVMGLDPVGAAAGCAADMVLVPDVDLGDVLAGWHGARVVLHAGRVVADTRVRRQVSLPSPVLDADVTPTASRPLSPVR